MKKIALAVVVLAALLLSACSSNVSREAAFYRGMKAELVESKFLKQAEAYIDADPKLKETSKKIRKGTVERIRALLETEKNALKGEED